MQNKSPTNWGITLGVAQFSPQARSVGEADTDLITNKRETKRNARASEEARHFSVTDTKILAKNRAEPGLTSRNSNRTCLQQRERKTGCWSQVTLRPWVGNLNVVDSKRLVNGHRKPVCAGTYTAHTALCTCLTPTVSLMPGPFVSLDSSLGFSSGSSLGTPRRIHNGPSPLSKPSLSDASLDRTLILCLLSFSHSLSQRSVSVPVSVSLPLCLFVAISLPVFLLVVAISLSLSVSLLLPLSPFLSPCCYFSLALCLFVAISLSHVQMNSSVSVSVWIYIPLSLDVCLLLSLSLSL